MVDSLDLEVRKARFAYEQEIESIIEGIVPARFSLTTHYSTGNYTWLEDESQNTLWDKDGMDITSRLSLNVARHHSLDKDIVLNLTVSPRDRQVTVASNAPTAPIAHKQAYREISKSLQARGFVVQDSYTWKDALHWFLKG